MPLPKIAITFSHKGRKLVAKTQLRAKPAGRPRPVFENRLMDACRTLERSGIRIYMAQIRRLSKSTQAPEVVLAKWRRYMRLRAERGVLPPALHPFLHPADEHLVSHTSVETVELRRLADGLAAENDILRSRIEELQKQLRPPIAFLAEHAFVMSHAYMHVMRACNVHADIVPVKAQPSHCMLRASTGSRVAAPLPSTSARWINRP